MDKHTIRLKREKETKNTIRFAEVEVEGKPPVLGSIYVPKYIVGQVEEIDVTVAPVDGKSKGK